MKEEWAAKTEVSAMTESVENNADNNNNNALEENIDTEKDVIDSLEPEEGADESKHAKLLLLLNEKLLECINRVKADEFCVSYCYLNTKNAKKRLIQSLIKIPRSRGELAGIIITTYYYIVIT